MNLKEIVPIDASKIAGSRERRAFIKRVDSTVKIRLDSVVIRENFNDRTEFGAIEEMANTLDAFGQISPIRGDMMDDGTFIVTYGERRIRGMRMLQERGSDKFEYVLAEINPKDMTDAERHMIALIENSQRKNYEPLEEAVAYKRMIGLLNPETGKNWTASEISRAVGVTKMHVSNRLKLAGVTEEERTAVVDGVISPTALTEMVKAGATEEQRKEAIAEAKESGETIKVEDVKKSGINSEDDDEAAKDFVDGYDPLFQESARLIVLHQQGSTSLLQRKLKLGYNRAGRIVDQLEQAKIIGPFEGSKAREVYVATLEDLDDLFVSLGIIKDDEYTQSESSVDPDEVMGGDAVREADHQEIQDSGLFSVNNKKGGSTMLDIVNETLVMLNGVAFDMKAISPDEMAELDLDKVHATHQSLEVRCNNILKNLRDLQRMSKA